MATEPYTPFPVSGTVYQGASTAVYNANVILYNQTKNTYLSTKTDAAGAYMLDLANLSDGWDSSDVLFLIATYPGHCGEIRAKITTTDTDWNQNIYLRTGETQFKIDPTYATMSHVLIQAINISSSGAGTYSVVSVFDNEQKDALNVSANGTTNVHYGNPGIRTCCGFVILKATQGTYAYGQTIGVSNAIGDTSSNVAVNITSTVK